MTRAQFLALAGKLYDAQAGGGAPSSGGGRPPKFDTSISRKGGLVQYASETDLAGLMFWRDRALEPPRDPKYAEKNAKEAKALGYWVVYRESEPSACWTGERNRVQVTAAPPSDKPDLYERGAPAPAAFAPTPVNDDGEANDDDQIPF
jgi:hypothetical protein